MAATLTNIDSARAGPAPGYHHLSEARIKSALQKHAGNISAAAHALCISRQALHSRIQRSCELQAVVQNARDVIADLAESKIVEAIRCGDLATTRWYADRQMRDRGYGQRVETADVTPKDPVRAAQLKAIRDEMIAVLQERAREKAAKPPAMIEGRPTRRSR